MATCFRASSRAHLHRYVPIVLFFAICCSSARVAERDADRRSLLAMHEEALVAHRESNVERLLGAEPSAEFVVANRGAITYPTIEERRSGLGSYLQRTRFSVYRDQVPPIVKISADGTLGWVIAQVEAKGVQTTDAGTTQPLQFVSAWIELYEKRSGRWVAVGNVSNFKP